MSFTIPAERKMLLFRNFPFFDYITDDEYRALGIQYSFIQAKRGEYIYFPHQHAHKLYFLKEGFIKIGYIAADGAEVIREVIQRKEVFGQLTIEKNNDRDEFAQACKTDVSICAFNIEDFYRILERKPQMAISYSVHLGEKVRKFENRIMHLLRKDVRERLIQFFLQLIEDAGGPQNNAARIERFLSHEEMAQLIGASRQTVTTMLNQLHQEHLIDICPSHFSIPDFLRLKQAV